MGFNSGFTKRDLKVNSWRADSDEFKHSALFCTGIWPIRAVDWDLDLGGRLTAFYGGWPIEHESKRWRGCD